MYYNYYIVRSWWINGDFFPKWRAENAEYSQVITHITKASYLPISRQHASPILSWKTLLTSPLSIAGSKTRMKYPDFSPASAACKCSSTSIQGGAGAVSCQEALSVLQLQSWFQNKAIKNHLFIWYLDSGGYFSDLWTKIFSKVPVKERGDTKTSQSGFSDSWIMTPVRCRVGSKQVPQQLRRYHFLIEEHGRRKMIYNIYSLLRLHLCHDVMCSSCRQAVTVHVCVSEDTRGASAI